MSIKSIVVASATVAALAGSMAQAYAPSQSELSRVVIGVVQTVNPVSGTITLSGGASYGIDKDLAKGLLPGDTVEIHTAQMGAKTLVTEAFPRS
jgi:hypothetical protein